MDYKRMNAPFTEVKDLVCCIEISENYFISKVDTGNVYLLPRFLKINNLLRFKASFKGSSQ